MAASTTPSAFEGELHCMIGEYLDHAGLVDTKISFEDECLKLRKPIDEIIPAKTFKDERAAKMQNEMFAHFDAGKRAEFFQCWDCCISPDTREGDSWCQKLEFHLNTYFAIYPMQNKKSVDDCENAMCQFRYYLETRGSTLSQSPEFLQYYALPFVPSPRSHESFRELFELNWSSDLRLKLETFLGEELRETGASTSAQPRLIELYQCNDFSLKEVKDDLRICEKKLSQTEKRSTAQSKQLIKLQDDYQKLMGVTAELITALEAAVRGDWVDIDQVLSACSVRFPEIFHGENESGQNRRQQLNGQQNGSSRPSSSVGVQRFKETLQDQSDKVSLMRSLDFDKIKKDVTCGDLRLKLLLTQALRWRITKGADQDVVDILNSFIKNDVLGCDRPSEYRQKLLHNIRSPSKALRQSFARLLNVFASFSSGRTYLAKCPQLLAVLIENIRSDDPDQVTLDMTLGTLQKLSLRRTLQTSMIEADVIDWLITTLEEYVTLSEYSLEYASALLMNLCLRTAGKNKCARYPRRALSLLISLLDIGQRYTTIIPYVNGAMYSILSMASIKKEALRFGLSKVLEVHMEQANNEMKRQYEYIMKQLNGPLESKKNDACSDVEDDDEDDDEDELELDPELDKNDLVIPQDGELGGEKLLSANYIKQGKRLDQSLISSFSNERRKKPDNEMLKRPSTPRTNHSIGKTSPDPAPVKNPSRHASRPSSKSNVSTPAGSLTSPVTSTTDDVTMSQLSTMSSDDSRFVSSQRTFPSPDGFSRDPKTLTSTGTGDTVKIDSSSKYSSDLSRPSTAGSRSSPSNVNRKVLSNSFRLDKQATDIVSRVTGKSTALVAAEKSAEPSTDNFAGLNGVEYVAAFSTRPKIPRTPDSASSQNGSPTSRHNRSTPTSTSSSPHHARDRDWAIYD